MIYTVDTASNVAAHQSEATFPQNLDFRFTSSKELTGTALQLPMDRLVSIWNNLAPRVGLNPVKKFENRQVAIVRIWRAAEKLASEACAAAAPEPLAPVPMPTTETKTLKLDTAIGTFVSAPIDIAACAAPKAKPAKKPRAKRATAATNTTAPKEGTRTATVLALIGRKGGATLNEIMKATGWQAHSVRGFICTLGKKGLANIESSRREDGARVYSSR